MQFNKLVAYGSLVSALVLGPGAALADNDAHNDTTGPDSNNEVSVEVENKAWVKVENNAEFFAELGLEINTGGNLVKKNTTAGDNKGGDVDVNIDGSTEISQSSDLCECLGDMFASGDNSASNQNTGPQSNNEANIDVKNKLGVKVENNASVGLAVGAAINTGDNTSKLNTTAGDTESGDVSFSFSWNTTINQGN